MFFPPKVKQSRDIINKAGMPTTLLLSDNEVKTTIFEVGKV
jgi:hypothetical protein